MWSGKLLNRRTCLHMSFLFILLFPSISNQELKINYNKIIFKFSLILNLIIDKEKIHSTENSRHLQFTSYAFSFFHFVIQAVNTDYLLKHFNFWNFKVYIKLMATNLSTFYSFFYLWSFIIDICMSSKN